MDARRPAVGREVDGGDGHVGEARVGDVVAQQTLELLTEEPLEAEVPYGPAARTIMIFE